jgi:serine/threonine-protein kinase
MNEQQEIARFVVRQGLLTPAEAEQALEQCREAPVLDWLQRHGWLTPQQVAGLDELRRLACTPVGTAEQHTENAPGRPVEVCADTPDWGKHESASSSDPLSALFGLPEGDWAHRGKFFLEEDSPRGKGGMGQVWLAHDSSLGRQVALKEMRPDLAGQHEARRRFLLEAQVTSQLQHPGIVPVYEMLQSESGPVYTMRFVEGRTLAQAIAECHRQPTPAALHDLLGAFAQVCNTLAYAHSKGVVHRDLKPANVLLGGFGEVVVLDWGLALVLASRERARRNETSTTVQVDDPVLSKAAGGTPAYMAPEQARGEIDRVDERADVFGLGGILCEILTGAPPFGGKGGAALLQAQQADLPDALTRLSTCGADDELAALAKRCLAPQMEERPRDAAHVAKAVADYRAGVAERLRQAELAGAEERARAGEQRKRYRLLLALAGSVLVTVLLGAGGYVWLLRQRDERRAATTRGVEEQLAQAFSLRPVTSKDFDEALSKVAQAEHLLASGEGGPGLAERISSVREQLEEGRARAQEQERDNEAVRRLLTQLRRRGGPRPVYVSPEQIDQDLGDAFRELGLDLDRVEPSAVGARLKARTETAEIAAILQAWMIYRRSIWKDGKGSRSWQRLAAVARAIDPDPWRNGVRDLLGQHYTKGIPKVKKLAADTAALERQPAVSLILVARILKEVADDPEAADAVLHLAWRRFPTDFQVNYQIGQYCLAANSQGRPERPAEAVAYLMAAVTAQPDHPAGYWMLGLALRHTGKTDEAISCQRKVLVLDPGFSQARVELGAVLQTKGDLEESIRCYQVVLQAEPKNHVAHNSLGAALNAQGKYDDAARAYRKSIDCEPRYPYAHNNLGLLMMKRQQWDKAVAHCSEAVKLAPKAADLRVNLGNTLLLAGRLDEGIARYHEAIGLDARYALAPYHLGVALYAKGRKAEAREYFHKALQIDPKFAKVHNTMGGLLLQEQKIDEAIEELRKALRIDPGHLETLIDLAGVLVRKGKTLEAIGCYRKALRIAPQRGDLHGSLGVALDAAGRQAEAIDAWRESVRLAPGLAMVHYWLGKALLLQGRPTEAAESLRQAAGRLPPGNAQALGLSQELSGARRLSRLEERLPALLAGKDRPRDNQERLELCELCRRRHEFAAAAAWWGEALAGQPELGKVGNHYFDAARVASLAAAGKGKGAGGLSKRDRLAFRRRALTWLRADLALRKKQLASWWPGQADKARATLAHLQTDPDLADLRDLGAPKKLSVEERQACERLWAEVKMLLKSGAPK